jgi:hypothetical protein
MRTSPGPGGKTATLPAASGPQPAPQLAPVIPIGKALRRGGRAWRKAHGLETIADLVSEYLARRFLRHGALHPLPEDLAPGWRELAK